jgi:chromate transport protein ChrA
MPADTPTPPGTWTRRRRIINATLVYCAVIVVWLTERHPDSPLVSQVVLGLIALAGGVIGSYVFGATWDDANARKAGQ